MNTYIVLFLEFFKIGMISFGGGTAMLPIIYQSISRFGHMTGSEFSDMVALSQVTPGPVAVNAATYVGIQWAGIAGGIVATVGVCLPCFCIMLAVMKILQKVRDNRIVEGAFVGIRPVTIGLVLAAAVFIAKDVLVKGSLISTRMVEIGYYNMIPVAIFGISILLMSLFKVKPLWVMLIMGFAGAMIYGLGGVPMV